MKTLFENFNSFLRYRPKCKDTQETSFYDILFQFGCTKMGFYLVNFKSHISLNLNLMNIQCLYSNFVDCASFLELNSPYIPALCETNLDGSIDSCNFFVRGYLPLILKDSSTHMHGLTVYVKEGLPFAQDLSLENCANFYLCFWLALLQSVCYFFFLNRSSSLSLCMVFYSISSNINEFSQSTHLNHCVCLWRL